MRTAVNVLTVISVRIQFSIVVLIEETVVQININSYVYSDKYQFLCIFYVLMLHKTNITISCVTDRHFNAVHQIKQMLLWENYFFIWLMYYTEHLG